MANTPRHPAFYTRYGNPVQKRVEAILAELEGTETALLMASGMGAISTTILALVSRGDHVIAQRRHYMSTSKLFEEVLPRFGVESTIVDQTDLNALAAAIRSEEHTSELQSLMRISYSVFCLKKTTPTLH